MNAAELLKPSLRRKSSTHCNYLARIRTKGRRSGPKSLGQASRAVIPDLSRRKPVGRQISKMRQLIPVFAGSLPFAGNQQPE
jgi:hypothetical protein